MSKSKRKDVGAIWVQKTKKGERYLSMSIKIGKKTHQFVAFINRKMKSTHPDYRIFPSTPPKPEPKKKPPDPFPY